MRIAQSKISIFYFLLFVFLFSDCKKSVGQTLEQTLAFASDQYRSGSFSNAIITYHRILFFDSGENRSTVFQNLGDCYFQTGNYEEAAKNYSLAYYSEKNDSVKKELIFKTTQNYLLVNNYLGAKTELFNLPENLSPYFEQKTNFYKAITAWGLADFAASEKYFIACLESGNDSSATLIKKEFNDLYNIGIKPRTAAILSIIIPGAGQLYSGDYKNAINSFVINIAFLGLYLYVMQAYTLFDAVLTVFPWFQRYYTGGVKKAELIANRKISSKRNNIYHNIMEIIAKAKK